MMLILCFIALRATCDIQIPKDLHFSCISIGNKIITGLFRVFIVGNRIPNIRKYRLSMVFMPLGASN